MSEPPQVPKWPAVKFGRMKKMSDLVVNRTDFDGWPFWNQLEFRHVMYLILMVYSCLIWFLKLKGVAAFLLSNMAI